MSEMVERVALAMAKTNGGDFYDPDFYTEEQRNVWRTKARDGIEAMREPTKAMMDQPTWYDGDKSFTPGDAEAVWDQMIDAALK